MIEGSHGSIVEPASFVYHPLHLAIVGCDQVVATQQPDDFIRVGRTHHRQFLIARIHELAQGRAKRLIVENSFKIGVCDILGDH